MGLPVAARCRRLCVGPCRPRSKYTTRQRQKPLRSSSGQQIRPSSPRLHDHGLAAVHLGVRAGRVGRRSDVERQSALALRADPLLRELLLGLLVDHCLLFVVLFFSHVAVSLRLPGSAHFIQRLEEEWHYSATFFVRPLAASARRFLFSVRRSFAVSPPQTPYSTCVSPYSRHCSFTGQPAQIFFASRTFVFFASLKKYSACPTHAACARQTRVSLVMTSVSPSFSIVMCLSVSSVVVSLYGSQNLVAGGPKRRAASELTSSARHVHALPVSRQRGRHAHGM